MQSGYFKVCLEFPLLTFFISVSHTNCGQLCEEALGGQPKPLIHMGNIALREMRARLAVQSPIASMSPTAY